MSTRHGTTSVARLYGLGFTPGKLRGVQRICNDNGTMTMVATDQNSSMIGMIKDALKKKGEEREPNFSEVVEAKIVLASALVKHASAVLVDGYYGVWNSVACFSIPKHIGILVRVEKSGGTKNAVGAPLMDIEPGWGVGKIKRCGADAVKLLAPFEPSEPASAEHQTALVQRVYEECKKHDILMLLETVAFPFGSEKKDSPAYLKRKAETVIESARYLSAYCDIYKAEFPGFLGQESDAQLRKNLEALNAASVRPWVLLSAGVDFPEYKQQVQMAMEAGASGILGGRAFWKEYFQKEGPAAREAFARGEASDRVKQIHDIVVAKAKPWYQRYALSMEELSTMRAAENWHFRYGESAPSAKTEGEVWGY